MNAAGNGNIVIIGKTFLFRMMRVLLVQYGVEFLL